MLYLGIPLLVDTIAEPLNKQVLLFQLYVAVAKFTLTK